MATGLVLGHLVHEKTKALREGCSWLNSPLPQPDNTRKTGTRQNLVGPGRALKQLRDPFPGPDRAQAGLECSVVLAPAVLHWCCIGAALVLHWCCGHGGCGWGSTQLAWAPLVPPLFPPFPFSLNAILRLPALSFSTKPGKPWLGGRGKGLCLGVIL